MHFTLTPAYGRDYKNKAAVLADFNANKDFVQNGFASSGYVSKGDMNPGDTANIRYDKLRKVAVVKL